MCIMPGSEPEAVLSILGEAEKHTGRQLSWEQKSLGLSWKENPIYRWGRSFLRAYSSWGTRTGYQIASCG